MTVHLHASLSSTDHYHLDSVSDSQEQTLDDLVHEIRDIILSGSDSAEVDIVFDPANHDFHIYREDTEVEIETNGDKTLPDKIDRLFSILIEGADEGEIEEIHFHCPLQQAEAEESEEVSFPTTDALQPDEPVPRAYAEKKPPSKNLLKRFYKAIRAYLFVKFRLTPFLDKEFASKYKKLTKAEIENIFTSRRDLEAAFNKILDENPTIGKILTKEELVECIESKMVTSMNQVLQKNGHSLIGSDLLKQLRIRAAAEAVMKDNYSTESISTKNADMAFIQEQDPALYPFEKMRYFPDENDPEACQEWLKNTASRLAEAGGLNDLNIESTSDGIKKLKAAFHYLEMVRNCPEEHMEALTSGDLPDPEALITFIATKSDSAFTPSAKGPRLDVEEMEIWKGLSKQFDASLQKALYAVHLNEDGEYEPGDQIDRKRLAALLIGNNIASESDLFGNTILKELNPEEIIEETSETIHEEHPNKAVFFSEDHLAEIFGRKLDELAIDHLRLNDSQLQAMQEHRSLVRSEDIEKTDEDDLTSVINDLILSDAQVEAMKAADAKQVQKESSLSPQEAANLMLVTRLVAKAKEGSEITDDEKRAVSTALQEMRGDKRLNKKLQKYGTPKEDPTSFLSDINIPKFIRKRLSGLIAKPVKYEEPPYGISREAVDFARKLSFRTKEMVKFEKVVEKARTLNNEVKADAPITVPPLTLRELGSLADLKKMAVSEQEGEVSFKQKPLTEVLDLLGVTDEEFSSETGTYRVLKTLALEASSILDDLNAHIGEELAGNYEDGDLLAYDGFKKRDFLGRELPPEEHFTTKLFRYIHGGVLYHRSDSQMHVSEVFSAYSNAPLKIQALSYSDIWRIDPLKLIDKNLQKTLKNAYGDDWKETLEEQYREFAQEIHKFQKNHYLNLRNDNARRVEAGRAHFDNTLALLTQNPEAFKGHTRKTERGFETLESKFSTTFPENTGMICSEFATKATIVTMLKFNRWLAQDIQEKLGEDDGFLTPQEISSQLEGLSDRAKEFLRGDEIIDSKQRKGARKEVRNKLVERGFSKEQANFMVAVAEKNILKLPYSSYERLRAVHPGRMVQLLKDKNCVKKVAPPERLKQIITI